MTEVEQRLRLILYPYLGDHLGILGDRVLLAFPGPTQTG
jgi:hypothetical protein